MVDLLGEGYTFLTRVIEGVEPEPVMNILYIVRARPRRNVIGMLTGLIAGQE